MFGNAYLKPSTKRIDNDRGQLYWLDSSKIKWDEKTLKKMDKMVLSKSSYNDILNSTIAYHYNDGTKQSIALKELIHFADLSNNTGNWYKGNSRIEALSKILSNVDGGLDAKNINLEFSRKYLVGGNYDPTTDLSSFKTMQDIEKEDIERKLRSNKAVHPIKSQINIQRFVEDMAELQLDEAYNQDLLKVGSMYNIPKELLDAIAEGSTYENQEKALSRHIAYSEMPKAMDLLEGLTTYFGVKIEDYEMSWSHLPFMQVFEKDRAEVNSRNAQTLKQLVESGADVNGAAELLGINLEFNGKVE